MPTLGAGCRPGAARRTSPDERRACPRSPGRSRKRRPFHGHIGIRDTSVPRRGLGQYCRLLPGAQGDFGDRHRVVPGQSLHQERVCALTLFAGGASPVGPGVEQWADAALVDETDDIDSAPRRPGEGGQSLFEEHDGAAVRPLHAARNLRWGYLHVFGFIALPPVPEAGSVARARTWWNPVPCPFERGVEADRDDTTVRSSRNRPRSRAYRQPARRGSSPRGVLLRGGDQAPCGAGTRLTTLWVSSGERWPGFTRRPGPSRVRSRPSDGAAAHRPAPRWRHGRRRSPARGFLQRRVVQRVAVHLEERHRRQPCEPAIGVFEGREPGQGLQDGRGHEPHRAALPRESERISRRWRGEWLRRSGLARVYDNVMRRGPAPGSEERVRPRQADQGALAGGRSPFSLTASCETSVRVRRSRGTAWCLLLPHLLGAPTRTRSRLLLRECAAGPARAGAAPLRPRLRARRGMCAGEPACAPVLPPHASAGGPFRLP